MSEKKTLYRQFREWNDKLGIKQEKIAGIHNLLLKQEQNGRKDRRIVCTVKKSWIILIIREM